MSATQVSSILSAIGLAKEEVYRRRMHDKFTYPADNLQSYPQQAWASTDPHGAYSWYESNKEKLNPREKKEFEAKALAALAKDNFDLAFNKVKNVSSASRKQVLSTFGAAVANNPEQRGQFTKYLMTLDDKEARNDAAEDIAGSLARTDPQEAVRFVDQWPGEDKSDIDKDELYSTAARRVMWDEDYAGAAQWASGIKDEKERARR